MSAARTTDQPGIGVLPTGWYGSVGSPLASRVVRSAPRVHTAGVSENALPLHRYLSPPPPGRSISGMALMVAVIAAGVTGPWSPSRAARAPIIVLNMLVA